MTPRRSPSRHAILPGWFTTVLGATAPTDDTAGWFGTAVELIAYRITYEIIDPVVALGPPVTGAGRRAEWRLEIDRALARYRGE